MFGQPVPVGARPLHSAGSRHCGEAAAALLLFGREYVSCDSSNPLCDLCQVFSRW